MQRLTFTSDVFLPGEKRSLNSILFITLHYFVRTDAELFLTTSPYVDPASSRVPDGEEEDRLAQMDEAQL